MSTTKKNATTTSPTSAAPAAASSAPAIPPPPDPNLALSQLVQQAIAQLDAIESQLGADPTVSPPEKRRAIRMRKGGAGILATIATLAAQHQLESPAMQVAPMEENAARAAALQPLANRIAALGRHVDDLVFGAQGTAWDMALQFYTVLQRRARSDGDLQAALQPVTQFFAYRHKASKAQGEPTKTQRRATARAVRSLKKTAPQLLASASASAATPAPAPAPAPAPGS